MGLPNIGPIELLIILSIFVWPVVGYYISNQKGREPIEGCALGCALGPIGWVIAALLPSKPALVDAWPASPPASVPPTGAAGTIPTKRCPDCAETVLADARICRFCRYEFDAL